MRSMSKTPVDIHHTQEMLAMQEKEPVRGKMERKVHILSSFVSLSITMCLTLYSTGGSSSDDDSGTGTGKGTSSGKHGLSTSILRRWDCYFNGNSSS